MEPDSTPAPKLFSPLSTLFPGYFSLVMATGIVSIAAHFMEYTWISRALFCFNVIAYCVLWALTLARVLFFTQQILADIMNNARSVLFLTMVAGTMVLGSQFALMSPYMGVAKALWWLGILLWVVLIYTFFTVNTVHEPKPKFEDAINGAWLLATVSTESICVLGTLVAPSMRNAEAVFFVSLSAYLLGAMFYIVLIALIVYRWFFFSLPPDKLTPPYWINMGALAITTLAGSRLLLSTTHWPFLETIRGFITGFTLFFWVTGTWWIPLLIFVGIWRHVAQRAPLKYDPQYWSLVFPIGMYTVSTFIFAQATGLQVLASIPVAAFYVALAAWALTFAGMMHALARQALHREA
ncbi:MAG: tellurite resistance/C4-dicarboxylate transporter family protein [Candidatus Hydrogenedentes bacterium]|nr:tellurite resistance/C4-dicarboxylate transporter family protein [Candidatus Hydrogenedentota bacterium]